MMAVADVLETRISTRARKGQESQNYLKRDCCRQNENDIPIKDNMCTTWLPPFCKQNLLLFIQPGWQLRTYFFSHYNVLF